MLLLLCLMKYQKSASLQEKGRIIEKEITLARANWGVRLFEHVVNALSTGNQPDLNQIKKLVTL